MKYKTKASSIDSYQKGDKTSEQRIFAASKTNQEYANTSES